MASIENAFKKLDEHDTSAIQKHLEILTKTLHYSIEDPRIHWEETLNVLTELWNRYQKRLLEIKKQKAEIDTMSLSVVKLQRELKELRQNNDKLVLENSRVVHEALRAWSRVSHP